MPTSHALGRTSVEFVYHERLVWSLGRAQSDVSLSCEGPFGACSPNLRFGIRSRSLLDGRFSLCVLSDKLYSFFMQLVQPPRETAEVRLVPRAVRQEAC